MALKRLLFRAIEKYYHYIDKSDVRRTKNLHLIPEFINRKGGKLAYVEWAHVIGIFQTLIYQVLEEESKPVILDIGCGTGLLGIACNSFLEQGGSYTGLDIDKASIEYCLSNYNSSNYDFVHFNKSNGAYAKDQSPELRSWPIDSINNDLVLALSVWTHLLEKDAIFYFQELGRVLKPNGKAIITFFYLDDIYEKSLTKRNDEVGRFHNSNQMKWIFKDGINESIDWKSPNWAIPYERAIGITPNGLSRMLENTQMKLIAYYPGNWKEIPGVYFQDILVFEKQY